jgi:hypothetical protein
MPQSTVFAVRFATRFWLVVVIACVRAQAPGPHAVVVVSANMGRALRARVRRRRQADLPAWLARLP